MSTLPDKYIVEHPNRGILMELDQVEPYEWKPRWSWSKQRSEAMVFPTARGAFNAISRLPENQRRLTEVRRYGSWSKVERES